MIMNRAQRRAQSSNKANAKAIGGAFSAKMVSTMITNKSYAANTLRWTEAMHINPKIKLDQEAAAAPNGYA